MSVISASGTGLVSFQFRNSSNRFTYISNLHVLVIFRSCSKETFLDRFQIAECQRIYYPEKIPEMNDFEEIDSLKSSISRKGYIPNGSFSRKVQIPDNFLQSVSCQCPKYKRNRVILPNLC